MDIAQLLHLAKQGHTEAIATLMTQALAAQGVTAQAKLRQGCLEVVLTGRRTPDQRQCLHVIRQGLIRLEVPFIHTVKVYALCVGSRFPNGWRSSVWRHRQRGFLPAPNPLCSPVPPPKLPTGCMNPAVGSI